MHFSTTALPLLSLGLFTLAAAQTTRVAGGSSDSSACAALPVLEACIASTEAVASACAAADYNCLCEKHSAVLTCFDQCPNDARRSASLSLKTTYCANAVTYSSSTVKPISAPASTESTATATGTGAGATATAGSDDVRVASTTTGAGASATSNAAVGRKLGAMEMASGGFVVGIAGVLGLL